MLNFDEFKTYIVDQLEKRFADDNITVQVNDMLKNNDTSLTALTFVRESQKTAPTIYLEEFFNSYSNIGMDIDEIIDRITDRALQHLEEGRAFDDIAERFQNFDEIKDVLSFAVVNTASNRERLAGLVHREFEDLSIICKVNIDMGFEQNGSITVRPEHLAVWGISEEELFEITKANMQTFRPGMITRMGDVVGEIIGQSPEELNVIDEVGMLVVTNESKFDGAACILDDVTMKHVAEIYDEDFFILPSSVHELICVPSSMGDAESLALLVRQVNETEVSPEEMLSNHVYQYDCKTQTISLADTTLDQIKVAEEAASYNADEEVVRGKGRK